MNDDEKRAALNQAVARDANETVEDVAAAWDPPADPIDIRCECSRADCRELLRVSHAEYEYVRDDPRHFLVVPEHVDERIDRVIGSVRTYALVEKIGDGASVAEETDPRA
jgi:hypothetical protein